MKIAKIEATPLAIPWAAADCVWPSAHGWLLLAGIGAATQVGQVFLTKGLAVERAGRATSIGYLQICFAIVWQLLVFGDAPSVWTLAGASLRLDDEAPKRTPLDGSTTDPAREQTT